MTFLRTGSRDRKHYTPGKKRAQFLEDFEEACRAKAIEEVRVPIDWELLERAISRYHKTRSVLNYSIGKLENKACQSKRAAHRMKKENDAYRERLGEVDGNPTTQSE